MNYLSLFFFMCLSQFALSAPIVVTRVHTAEAVTSTDTYTTITNTHTAPTVQILVSDGVSYTFTLTDATFAEPTTFTSFVNKAATTQDTAPAAEATPATEAPAAETPAAASPVTTTLTPSTAAPADSAPQATSEAQATTNSPTPAAAQDNNQGNTQDNNQATTQANNDATTQANNDATTQANNDSTTQANNDATTTSETTQAPANSKPVEFQAPTTIASEIATGSTKATSTSSTSSPTTTSTSAGSSKAVPTAIVYSPYNDDNSCKDYDVVYSDLSLIKSTGINKVRIYGTDCNSIPNVLGASVKLGLKVNQGFWISSSGVDSIDGSVSDIISWANENSWDVFDFITIGNEAIISGFASASDLISKISSVKSKLQAAGYSGQVTTSEPPVIFEKHPELCTESAIDFVGINPHPYFDSYSSAKTAGSFVKGQYEIVQGICGDKEILVTETGYPSAGIQNGGNIPSPENQAIAIAAILDALDNKATILSTYNDYWKHPGDYGIEQSFGAIQLFE